MKKLLCAAFAFLSLSIASAAEIDWAGAKWHVRTGSGQPCASGIWSQQGVWVDTKGWLHLRMTRSQSGEFTCVEIESVKRFGFGRYSFEVSGPIGSIDKNVVFGIFMYPPKDVGEDGTNEIDIEIARWGHALAPQVNYTAWYRSHKGNRHDTVEVPKDLANATFDMTWQHDQVTWESPIQHGKTIDFRGDIADQPQTLIINLWLFHSPSPEDHNEVEFVIKSMRLQ